jgi:alanine racemase
MGYINPENLRVKQLPFSYAVYSLNQLNSVLNYQPEAGVHLFVDTGMGREGIPLFEFDNFVKRIPVERRRNIEGIMSHFAASLRPHDPRTKKQIKNFEKAVSILHRHNIFPKWRHIANSGGLINNKALRLDQVSNLARCGLAVYLLNPALRFLTHIAQIKTMAKDNTAGYDFTFTAKKNMKVAVLPVGYNDGVDRGLSNKGKVIINRSICPIIGRVSMNVTTVDVSNVANVKVGDEVVVYSDDNKLPNSIRATSSMLKDTIEYELLVHLNPEIKRVVV